VHPYLDGPYPRAFAHRGWHIGELAGMENSMRSFRRAALEGFCYLETDVHATADGVVVVLHDATLDRTTDGHGPIAAQRWAAVRTAKIDGKEPLCRLEDLLEDLPGVRINVDVKSDAAVPPVLEVLRRTGAWDRVCLASFSDQRLSRLRAGGGPRLITSLGRRAATALWLRSRLPLPPLPSLPSRVPPPPAPAARAPRRLAQLPHRQGRLTVVDPALVRHSHRLGTEVHVWTVDAAEEMVRLLDLGVDGLVTDRPDVLRTVLLARNGWPGRAA